MGIAQKAHFGAMDVRVDSRGSLATKEKPGMRWMDEGVLVKKILCEKLEVF
jgi:hypothetical protein